MNYGFDALKDLADALGIADTDISLGGNLSIAFGARGQGLSGAAAHYEQERHVINLTKMNGAGSLAHEWFHALDDFLGGYGSKFATEYGAKLPEATKAAVRHLLTTMQYRDATQEETDMAATKSYEQAKRSVTYQVSNQFGWVQKVENGTFQDHDARYYTRKPTAADAERYHALLDKLLETGDAAIVDELSALRKEVTGHVIPKEDRDSIGFRLSALRPDATRNVQKMRLRSDFYNGSRRFGELHHKDGDYWDSTIEMAARAFACYVADKTGKGGLSVFHEFWSGHSRYAFNVKKVIDFTGKTFTEEEVNAWEKETADIELSDGLIVRMKIAHIMSFHELRKDADSLRHIIGDGLRVPVYRGSDGKKVSDDGHLLTIEDVNTIANTLTERQVEVADALQQFMATQGAKWGNEVSMKRFGEAMFTNPTYFPINSDGQRLQATINEREDGSDLYALLNVGFTKSRNENASNRIVLYSIFDVFTNHMATMAQYNAFALPILDALKWLNYQKTEEVTVTENGQQKTVRKTVDSVREQLNRVFGAPAEENGRAKRGYAEEFILNIIRDFNGSKIQGSPNEGLFKKMLHNYNVAQVSTNLRVVIQQISAIVRAGQVVNYKSILRAKKLKREVVERNIAEMEKYSGIAVWKSMGFYDINISRSLSDLIKHNGIKYGELSTAYLSGDISKTDAINWQMEYGEKSRDDAEMAVQAWVWRADNPKYKDLSDQKIDWFITHCVPAGIDVAFYYKAQDYVKKIESDGTSGNVKEQYVDYILSLGLSPYKAKAMWKALKNSTWKDTGTPFA